MKILFLLLSFLIAAKCQVQETCLSRDYGNSSTVCVCNSEHCDTIPPPEKPEEDQYLIYTSNKAGLRFDKEIGKFGASEDAENTIRISTDQKYQKILGWGGAFSDSTGINIASLEEDLQEKLLNSYFSENGIQYNLGRVPMGGSDFSPRGYSYDDGDVDPDLENFALQPEDYDYKIPYILKAKNLTGNNLRLFGSAWSSPIWMKDNDEFGGLGRLQAQYYQAWADYFIKFLDAYEDEGVHFWGMTTGNEPNTGIVPGNKINNIAWTSTNMGSWILNNLGPAIRNSNYSDIILMAHDDQRLYLPAYVDTMLANSIARDYIDGIAVHWYTDMTLPTITAGLLNLTHDHFPDKFILYTESSIGGSSDTAVILGSWERGEDYSDNIIDDVNSWVSGWVDWNMALDTSGGPLWTNDGGVDSPIIVNATAGEFYKQPMFYHLGHFSKFVPRDSVRVDSYSNVADVKVAAFQTPDNGTVVVILNSNASPVSLALLDDSKGEAQLQLTPNSITTILYW